MKWDEKENHEMIQQMNIKSVANETWVHLTATWFSLTLTGLITFIFIKSKKNMEIKAII